MFFQVSKNSKSSIVCNIPHSSTKIPSKFLKSYLLSKKDLKFETFSLSDLYTDILFKRIYKNTNYILSKISRILVDIERFENENEEPMAKVGMAALYTKTQYGKVLRKIDAKEREFLVKNIYQKYHQDFTKLVQNCLVKNDKCLIIDCHSFPSTARQYESDKEDNRPDICIGSDGFHTPKNIVSNLKENFETLGYSVKINSPFAGSIVPSDYYKKDKRISSVMIEVNRKLYMDEKTFKKTKNFKKVESDIYKVIKLIIENS